MVPPPRLDEPAPPEPGVAGDTPQPLGARRVGDDPVGGSRGKSVGSRQQRSASVTRSRRAPVAGSYSKSFPAHWNFGADMRSASTAALSGGHWPFWAW